MTLPQIIPLFPLPNVVMFPGVPLPLHIFESRYRDMVRDTKDGHGFIGMTLLKGDWRERYYGKPDVFPVGCAGRIVSVESLPDGKYNILLHGVREFTIKAETDDHSYREAEIDWFPSAEETLPGGLRKDLMTRMREYDALQLEEAARKLIDDSTLGDQLLVNFICYALDLSPLEKQSLLEATSLALRAERLREVMDFHLLEARSVTASSSGHSRRSH